MNIALIGLGKMGLGIAERLIKKQHTVYGFDYNEQARQAAQDIGVLCTHDIATLPKHASIFWLMVPAGQPVDDVINLLIPAMQPENIGSLEKPIESSLILSDTPHPSIHFASQNTQDERGGVSKDEATKQFYNRSIA